MDEISALLQEDRRFPPSDAWKRSAHVTDPAIYDYALTQPYAHAVLRRDLGEPWSIYVALTGRWSRIEAYFHTQKIREATLLDHTAIVDALERRDAAGARDAMHKHLARVEREFQRRWDEIVPGAAVPNGARRAVAQRKRATTQST